MEIARHVAEPLCERFRLPQYTNPDLLLCAVPSRVRRRERRAADPRRLAVGTAGYGRDRCCECGDYPHYRRRMRRAGGAARAADPRLSAHLEEPLPMKVSEVLEARRGYWRALEELCTKLRGRSRRCMGADTVSRFSALYRAACADLALADAYQLPPSTVHYLHQLVARAHNQLYRSRTFDFRAWLYELFVAVPQRLFADNCLRLAFVLFWGVFAGGRLAGLPHARLCRTGGRPRLSHAPGKQLRQSDRGPPDRRKRGDERVLHLSTTRRIGLMCFCWGLVFGIAGLYITISNALILGTVFGYMAKTPECHELLSFRDRARAVRADGRGALRGGRHAAGVRDRQHRRLHARRFAAAHGEDRGADALCRRALVSRGGRHRGLCLALGGPVRNQGRRGRRSAR